MDKKIFIINGSAGVGKDTFVELVSNYVSTLNYSSIDKVKEIAKVIGWDGTKDEQSRRFLSDLKTLTTKYNDMPFKNMQAMVDKFLKDNEHKIMFLHIREPEEIDRAKEMFSAKTILILRDSIKHIKSNMADANVFKYKYDLTFSNHGTIEELQSKVYKFLIAEGVL